MLILNKWIDFNGSGWLVYLTDIKQDDKYLGLRIHYLSGDCSVLYLDPELFTSYKIAVADKLDIRAKVYLKQNPEYLLISTLFKNSEFN